MSRSLRAFMLLLAAALAASCGTAEPPVPPRPTLTPTVPPTAPAAPLTRSVTDMLGREVRLPERVERAVALSPTAYDFLVALGLAPVAATADAPPEGGSSPIGRSIRPDFTAVAELQPDLVVADAAVHGGMRRQLDGFPYPVFFLSVSSYEDVLRALDLLGEATGRSEEAAQERERIEAAVAEVRGRLAGARGPRVLILTGVERDVYAATEETYVGDLVRLLGGENVMAGAPPGSVLPGYVVMAPDDATLRDPDVVLVIPAGEGTLAEEIRSGPQWAGVQAASEGRIYELDLRLFVRAPGPTVDEAVRTLARLLYPDRFAGGS